MPSLQLPIGNQKRLLILVISALVFPLLLSLLMSTISALQLGQGNLAAASQSAKMASYPLRVYSATTFRLLPCLESWKHAMLLTADSQAISAQAIAASRQEGDHAANFNYLHGAIQQANQNLLPFNHHFQNSPLSWLAKKLGHESTVLKLEKIAQSAQAAENLLAQLIADDQTWIVMLQNSDEIRAAGGFAGSYIVVPIANGKVQEFVVEDIYDADGQFKGYLEPPPGVSEYLSSNNGLRLPDANWEADFPSSAAQMMQFFALGNRQNVNGLVVINTPLVEDLFELIEPIYISDYDATIESSNLTELLRTERDEFFPGSVQKKHLLSLLINQVKFELIDLRAADYRQIAVVLAKHIAEKNLMAYSRKPIIQENLQNLGVTGSLSTYGASDFLYLVESNVGINKVNKNIDRQVKVEMSGEKVVVTIEYQNNNFPPTEKELSSASSRAAHNGYANYQRLVVLPHWQVNSVKVGDNLLEDFDLNSIETSDGQEFEQLGFLLTVKEQSSQSAIIEFTRTEPSQNTEKLTFLKQPGLKPYELTLEIPGATKTYTIDKDQVIDLENATILP